MRAIGLVFLITLASPAAAENLGDAIKLNCEKEWGENYRMQKYCREKQTEALREYTQIFGAAQESKTLLRMLGRCLEEWPEGSSHNWKMVVYCYKKQDEARRALN